MNPERVSQRITLSPASVSACCDPAWYSCCETNGTGPTGEWALSVGLGLELRVRVNPNPQLGYAAAKLGEVAEAGNKQGWPHYYHYY